MESKKLRPTSNKWGHRHNHEPNKKQDYKVIEALSKKNKNTK